MTKALKSGFTGLIITAMIISQCSVFAEPVSAKESQVTSVFSQSDEYQRYLENSSAYTVIPDAVDYKWGAQTASLAEELPSKYNVETDSGIDSAAFPRVRNQGKDGDCWAFAAIAAGEYSTALNNGKKYDNENNLWSEYHMAAAMNVTYDEQYKNFTLINSNGETHGGNREMASAYLTRTLSAGPVLLKDFDLNNYQSYTGENDDAADTGNGRQDYSVLLGKDRVMTLTQANYITDAEHGSSVLEWNLSKDGKLYINNIKYHLNDEVINTVKQAILEYGAVSNSYLSKEVIDGRYSDYYNSKTGSYCLSWEGLIYDQEIEYYIENGVNKYSFNTSTNHSITIVGWDDDYSWENFNSKNPPVSYDGSEKTYVNGAWIVRNSWGEDYGNSGYEYVSYMDPYICFGAAGYKYSDKSYDDIYYYDTLGVTGSQSQNLGLLAATDSDGNRRYDENGNPLYEDRCDEFGYSIIANRFSADENEIVYAIGVNVIDSADTFNIFINTAPAGEQPDDISVGNFDGIQLINPETGEVSENIAFTTPGYKLVELKEPITVSGDFDVYIRTRDELNNTKQYSQAVCQKVTWDDGTISSYFVPVEGVSFTPMMVNTIDSDEGSDRIVTGWNDISAESDIFNDDGKHGITKGNWCIKAYVGGLNSNPDPTSSPMSSPTPDPTSSPTPSPSPDATPDPSPSPGYDENGKFEQPDITPDSQSKTFNVTLKRIDPECADSVLLIGIYDKNDVLIDFRNYEPQFDENGEFTAEGIEYDENAYNGRIFVWSDGGIVPYTGMSELDLR